MIKPSELTDEMIEAEVWAAGKLGELSWARFCNRAVCRTTPHALQRICDVLNADKSGGGR